MIVIYQRQGLAMIVIYQSHYHGTMSMKVIYQRLGLAMTVKHEAAETNLYMFSVVHTHTCRYGCHVAPHTLYIDAVLCPMLCSLYAVKLVQNTLNHFYIHLSLHLLGSLPSSLTVTLSLHLSLCPSATLSFFFSPLLPLYLSLSRFHPARSGIFSANSLSLTSH